MLLSVVSAVCMSRLEDVAIFFLLVFGSMFEMTFSITILDSQIFVLNSYHFIMLSMLFGLIGAFAYLN